MIAATSLGEISFGSYFNLGSHEVKHPHGKQREEGMTVSSARDRIGRYSSQLLDKDDTPSDSSSPTINGFGKDVDLQTADQEANEFGMP